MDEQCVEVELLRWNDLKGLRGQVEDLSWSGQRGQATRLDLRLSLAKPGDRRQLEELSQPGLWVVLGLGDEAWFGTIEHWRIARSALELRLQQEAPGDDDW